MSATKARTGDKNVVHSLAKGFRVLEAFTSQRSELTLAEIARLTGSDNATAFRLLNTLLALGYVEKVPGTRAFRLTLKCLDLGFNALARSDLRSIARPVLRSLVGELNEAASLGVLDGTDIVYIERIQAGLVRLGIDVRIGTRVPIYSTAIGHALIAFMPRDAQLRILEARPREKVTPRTPVDLETILGRLDEVSERGYALSDQEAVTGLLVLAAPVFDVDGVPIAAVSVATPAVRIGTAEFEHTAGVHVLAAASSLSRALRAAGGLAQG